MAQQPAKDAEMQKLVDDFTQAWAKGDAKALAALHTADAIRADSTGQVTVGRANIEAVFAAGFAGPLKGTKLVIRLGQESAINPNTRVGSGTWEVTGAPAVPGTPTKGTYVNTLVRQGGRWILASSAVIGAPAGS
jgi:uncharacterized protein (TIGR02246 family)